MKRRTFVSASTAFGFQFLPAHVTLAQGGALSPSNKLRIAEISVGGSGSAALG
jgi:hypothetical protein